MFEQNTLSIIEIAINSAQKYTPTSNISYLVKNRGRRLLTSSSGKNVSNRDRVNGQFDALMQQLNTGILAGKDGETGLCCCHSLTIVLLQKPTFIFCFLFCFVLFTKAKTGKTHEKPGSFFELCVCVCFWLNVAEKKLGVIVIA